MRGTDSAPAISQDAYPLILRYLTGVVALYIGWVLWNIPQMEPLLKIYRHTRAGQHAKAEPRSGEPIMVTGQVKSETDEASHIAAFGSERHGGIAFGLEWREPDFHKKNILWARIEWMGNGNVYQTDLLTRTFTLRTDDGQVYEVDRNPGSLVPLEHYEFAFDVLLGKYVKIGNRMRIEAFCSNRLTVLGKLEIDGSGVRRIVGDRKHPLVLANGSMGGLGRGFLIPLACQLFTVSLFLVLLFTPRPKTFKERFTADPDRYFVFDQIGGPEQMAISLCLAWLGCGLFLSFSVLGSGFAADTVLALTFAGLLVLVRAARNVEYFIVASREEDAFIEVSRGVLWNGHRRLGSLRELPVEIRQKQGKGSAPNSCDIVLEYPGGGGSRLRLLSGDWNGYAAAKTALQPWYAFRKSLEADTGSGSETDLEEGDADGDQEAE